MSFVDSHCHLNMGRFKKYFVEKVSANEFDEKYTTTAVVERAVAAGVKYQLTIGVTLSSSDETAPIVDQFPYVFRTVGIHPQEVSRHLEKMSGSEIADTLRKQCSYPKTVGIGEIGLDYSKGKSDEAKQKRLFHLQLEIAEEKHLPVSIHSRDAQVDTIEVLRAHPNVTGVLHCFSGEEFFADSVLNLGYSIAVGGTVTYKKSDELRDCLKIIPLDRLLLETDAPFLAPVPMRGKVNESAFMIHTAKKVAEVLDISIEELAQATSDNFFRLFPVK